MVPGLEAPMLTDELLEGAIALMRGARVAVLTGAGVSTDSGIPDYRGEGAPVRTPMTFQAFLASETARKRYWAGSHLGWRAFGSAQPNAGHLALAELEDAGVVSGIVTQNVDGLHRRAGSRHVVELHGGMDRVLCLTCGQHYARQAIADRLAELNPTIDLETAIRARPDGDVRRRRRGVDGDPGVHRLRRHPEARRGVLRRVRAHRRLPGRGLARDGRRHAARRRARPWS